jgi:hypothetical protein
MTVHEEDFAQLVKLGQIIPAKDPNKIPNFTIFFIIIAISQTFKRKDYIKRFSAIIYSQNWYMSNEDYLFNFVILHG